MSSRASTVLLFLAVLAACDGPTRPAHLALVSDNDSAIPEALRAAYREDAARLALRHLTATGDSARTGVELPADLWDALYRALVRVYNARDLPARDSVVDLYTIHTFPNPTVRRIDLGLDSTAAWVRALRQGTVPTGEPRFDELVDTYDLSLERYYDFQLGDDFAVLRAAAPLNTIALAPMFRDIEGVYWTEPAGSGGDGSDIRATPLLNGWRLDYSVGFGDCPAGCIGRYTWMFRVSEDGSVTYVGATGPPPPPPGQSWP